VAQAELNAFSVFPLPKDKRQIASHNSAEELSNSFKEHLKDRSVSFLGNCGLAQIN